jgi:menaquinone-dependent protoporphyrinogen oxidase
MTAPKRILVGYATRHGSTEQIAQRIAERLRRRLVSAEVELRALTQGLDPHPYDAFVLGSPVYNGAWLHEANDFVCRNLDRLGGRPMWLFSVGSFDDSHRVIGRWMKQEPRGIGALLRAVHARDYRVFAGVIDADRWPWFGRLSLRLLGGRVGDQRDWHAIDRWSDQVALAVARAFQLDLRERTRATKAPAQAPAEDTP